jgi:hypothetical protein
VEGGALARIRVTVARIEGAARRGDDLAAELRRLARVALADGHPRGVVERAARLPLDAIEGEGPLPPFLPPEGPWLR